MREYEYITYGIENVLVDELVAVICQESFESKPYPDGFRRIFDNYRSLRQRFKDKSQELSMSDFPESELGAIAEEFESERNRFLEAFLVEVETNCPNLDVRQLADNYRKAISTEDIITTEKRVCIYPYLISQVRLFNERKYEDGTHN